MDEFPALADWTRWCGRFVLFTGKGGVGKTTITAATAVALADAGKRVLVVSTDPASNLDDVFAATISVRPTPVAGVARLSAMNIDPEAAAGEYRRQVLAPLRGAVPERELRAIEEQLSGQCTVEIAAFDAFSALVADPETTSTFDHVLFDTAPTGHTLRLLSLPAAWSDYIETTPEGASCLGPRSGLETKRALYEATMTALGDSTQTTVVLVSRAERAALREAARASAELTDLGITNQQHVINGLLAQPLPGDVIAEEFARRQHDAIDPLPGELLHVPTTSVALVGVDVTGVETLRALVAGRADAVAEAVPRDETPEIDGLDALVDDLAAAGPGVVMVMGKGGVGKTTVAVGIARGLAERGLRTHLSTTDPAGRPADVVGETTARTYGEPDRSRSRRRALCRGQAAIRDGSRSRAAGTARGRSSLAVHRGARGLPGVLQPATSGARSARGRGYCTDRTHLVAPRPHRRLPP